VRPCVFNRRGASVAGICTLRRVAGVLGGNCKEAELVDEGGFQQARNTADRP